MLRRAAVAALVGAITLPALALEVPRLDGRVTDLAGLFSTAEAAAIESELADLEADTGAQAAVLTIPSLEGQPLEDFSIRVVEAWRLGEAGRDNGVLVLIARDDRKIRIEVGYGLEGVLPDALCGRIIDHAMTPAFRRGDFGAGTQAAVDVIQAAIRGDPEAGAGLGEGQRSSDGVAPAVAGAMVFLAVIGTFALTALFSEGCGAWFLYLFLTPFFFAFPGAAIGPSWGVALAAAWLLGFPILRALVWRTDAGKAFRTSHPTWTTWTTGGGSWSGGGFSGGFSGGGGSFGGGGASGGW